MCNDLYYCVLLNITVYYSVLLCIVLYSFVLLCIGLCSFVLLFIESGKLAFDDSVAGGVLQIIWELLSGAIKGT